MNILDLVSPGNKPPHLGKLRAHPGFQDESLQKKMKKEELQSLVTGLVEAEKMTKRRLAEMIFDVMKDHEDPKMKEKSVKVLVRTLLKSGSLQPRALDYEQIIRV
jgi:hypothetical protein